MKITEALVELKLLEKRIAKHTEELSVIGISTEASQSKLTKELVNSQLQSLKDLMARRTKIKSLIVKSNATTEVKIGDKTMTVAEAIERKSSIAFDKSLHYKMSTEYSTVILSYQKIRDRIVSEVDNQLEALFKDGVKAEEFTAMRQQLLEKRLAELVDPCDALKIITELNASIEDFESSVDTALSISNAVTEITVD